MVLSMLYAAFLPLLIRFISRDIFIEAALPSAMLLIMIYITYSMFSDGKLVLKDAVEGAGITLYSIFGFAFMVYLCDAPVIGKWLFYVIFITTWVSDTCAFIVGVLFGKHKLCPKISPKKTIEGAVGGIVFCVIFFIAYGLILRKTGVADVNLFVIIPVAVFASVISAIGDLLMSHLKREHGIKDFGNIFPGHGGILDRFDSAIAVSIVIAFIDSFADIITKVN